MTSDVKLSHYYHTQIIQKTISKLHLLCECRETSTVEFILQTILILFYGLEFELQYEWTPHIFFLRISRFTPILSGAHDIK